MMRLAVLLSFVAVIFSGCAQTRSFTLTNSYDPAEAAYTHKKGTNTIKGSGVVRQANGGTVTTAGVEVGLMPVTAYSTERAMCIYGNSERGSTTNLNSIKWNPPTPQGYVDDRRTAVGDAQGFFEFKDVPDGSYRMATSITWQLSDYIRAGAILMQQVTVSGGETVTVVLAH